LIIAAAAVAPAMLASLEAVEAGTQKYLI